jgi:hypothetical protein
MDISTDSKVESRVTENVMGAIGVTAILSILCMIPWTRQGWYFPVTDAGSVALAFLVVLFIPRRSKLVTSEQLGRVSPGGMALGLSFAIYLGLLLFAMGHFAVDASLPSRQLFAKVANKLLQPGLVLWCLAHFGSRKGSRPAEILE